MNHNLLPLKFYSFWSINDKLDFEELKNQLDELKSAGLTGVVFHPRNYPNIPPYLGDEYMRIVSDIVLYAKSIGMAFWLYDENGWPSGTAGGEVLSRHPELTCQWLEIVRDGEKDISGFQCIVSFRFDGSKMYSSNCQEGELYHIILQSKKAVSSLDPIACEYFIEITHERYKSQLAPEAFEYITGFFSDEVAFLDGHSVTVQHGAVPWTDRLVEQYRHLCNEDLLSKLPLLFVNGKGYEIVRIRFWELLTDAINDGYYLPIKKWCESNGKFFTAHLKGEENPFFQLSYSGSCFHVLKNITLPAIDALERYPSNHYFPRIAFSVSSQFQSGDCLAEAMGGAGWGATPENFEEYMLWLAESGINHIVLHINQLRLKSQAIRDWPPSTPCHITWREAFPEVIKSIQKKAEELSVFKETSELLIVTPTRGVMSEFRPQEAMQLNEHDGSNIPDSRSGRMSLSFLSSVETCHRLGWRYDLTEERTIEEEGRVEENSLRIGKQSYRKIIVSKDCRWSDKGIKMLDKLCKLGLVIHHPLFLAPKIRKEVKDVDFPTQKEQKMLGFKQSGWKAAMDEKNLLAVEFEKSKKGVLTSRVMMKDAHALKDLEVISMDKIKTLTINQKVIEGKKIGEGYIFLIPDHWVNRNKDLTLEIVPETYGEQNPIVFLRGFFAVQSQSKFINRNENQLITAGPFLIKPLGGLDCNNFIESGLMFCNKPVKASKTIEIQDSMDHFYLKINQIKADAARIFIDGEDQGWCWGPDWMVECNSRLRPGFHQVVVELIPNGFNVFGPHHHMDGDRYLTSPAQYEGVKNFADRVEAPENTKIKEWIFVNFNIQGDLQIILDK